jgi:quinoprotein glucose dehydrogenase
MAWILQMIEQKPLGPAASGKKLYAANCAACHREDRTGAPPEFPPLTALADKYSSEDVTALLYRGTGRMPAFARLGGSAIDAIVQYVMTGKDTGASGAGEDPFFMKYRNQGYVKFLDPDGYPAVAPPWGTLNAIDLNTGKMAWKIPLGEYPELAARGMTNTGSENYGGPVVTAGGLVFIGATDFDRKFHAFDKSTGKLLWETTLPFAGNATPAVYEAGGREFVVIAAGGGKSKDPSGGQIVAFALPR